MLSSTEVTVAELDMDKLRKFAAEYGFWPGTSDDAHLEFLAEQDKRIERANRRRWAAEDYKHPRRRGLAPGHPHASPQSELDT